MKAIRKCGPLTKIFLCIVFASIILAIVHTFAEIPIKEALSNISDFIGNRSGWSAEKGEHALTFFYRGRPVVSIDRYRGLDLNKYAKHSEFISHVDDDIIHGPPGKGVQGNPGLQGPRGYDGKRGPTGLPGRGQVGRAGERGPAGQTGETGLAGATGAAGARGAAAAPRQTYTHKKYGCVNGQNIIKYTNKTVDECKQLCTNYGSGCPAFEYGVSYGGGGQYRDKDCQLQSSANSSSCNGAYHNLDLYVKN